MAAEWNRCAEMERLLSGSSLKLAFQQAGTQHLVSNISTRVLHPVVPANFEKTFSAFVQHSGLASWQLVSSRFVCRGLANDITSWAKSCLLCQRSKTHRHTRLPCCRSPSPSISGALLISTLTWWALYSTVVVATTFSQSLITHLMDGSNSPFWNICRGMCACFSFFLDNPFWGALNYHFWSWAAIYIKRLVTTLQYFTHNASVLCIRIRPDTKLFAS